MARTRVLFVTDLTYQARGRRYCDEDIDLSARLRDRYDVALCHPRDAVALMDSFDVVLVRNSGPAIYYREAHEEFRVRAAQAGIPVLAELTGRADQVGKGYLLELHASGFPVIPTADSRTAARGLPEASRYLAKPLHGADSVGLRLLSREDLDELDFTDLLVQPEIEMLYEVSFYFVGQAFGYALHAPDPDHRWRLVPYLPTAADLDFARLFVGWNSLEHGIQRIDACRTTTGELLLIEIEDLNPYLSLDLVDGATRERFVQAVADSIAAVAPASR